MTSSLHFDRRIASNYLLYRGELLRNGVVELDSSGKVLSVGSVERVDSLCNTEFYNGILLPGLVNAHCHLELSHLRGQITEQCGFASFAQQLGAVREKFTPEQIELAMVRAEQEMWREGVVAVGDISNSCDSLGVKKRSGIGYHTFAEHFGLKRKDYNYLSELAAAPNTSLTLHSTYSVSDECFRAIAREGDAPLSIHFLETAAERELYAGHGALHEWYESVGFECDFLHYGSPAERVVQCVPADRSVILVHNVDLRDEDISLIMNHFTAPVYWVVAPRSNRFISGGQPPLELMRSRGLNICVGTDSLSSNSSLSMLSELRAMNSVPLVERLMWATKNGACALGMNDLGEIEIGRHPSLACLSGIDFTRGEIGENSRLEKII